MDVELDALTPPHIFRYTIYCHSAGITRVFGGRGFSHILTRPSKTPDVTFRLLCSTGQYSVWCMTNNILKKKNMYHNIIILLSHFTKFVTRTDTIVYPRI